jgi:cytochrome c oxidase subunit II
VYPFSPKLVALAQSLPVDASAHGPALDGQLLLNLFLVLALFVASQVLLLAGVTLRRARIRAHGENKRIWRLEYLPLAALALLLTYLTVRAERLWAVSRYTGADPSAMQVEVTGVQFAWYFRYPGADARFGVTQPARISAAEGNPLGIDPQDPTGRDDIVSSELVLPAGRVVDLRLRAQDVIHGFFIPEMRLKQNAVPGQTIHLHFTPQKPGTYAILCSQLCGLGHYRMAARLRVLTQNDFAAWLAQKAAP